MPVVMLGQNASREGNVCLLSLDECRVADFAAEPLLGELCCQVSIVGFAREDIDVHLLKQIKGVNDDRARQNETDGRCSLGVRFRLLLLRWDIDIVPEMHLAFFHFNNDTDLSEESTDGFPIEG